MKQSDLFRRATAPDLDIRAEVYDLLTSDHSTIEDFRPTQDMPVVVMDYLIDCIVADADWNDTTHSRAEAFWELKVPLAPVWERYGVAMTPGTYWAKAEDMLARRLPEYVDAAVTHWLEGCGDVAGFRRTLRRWKADPKLARYAREVEEIIGRL